MASDVGMRALWDRFERWLTEHAPAATRATLGPAAPAREIAEFEARLGITLPEDVRESYAIHDGQRVTPGPLSPATIVDGLFDGCEFLSLDRSLHEWTVWEEILDSGAFNGIVSDPNGPVRTDWWHPRWIPFTFDGSGNHECFDFAPASGGAVGQVISFRHDARNRIVRAPSFAAWFDAYVCACERGDYAYRERDGAIARTVA